MTGAPHSPWLDQIRKQGYCIIPNALPSAILAALDTDLQQTYAKTPFGDGEFYGYKTKRFGSLLRRSRWAGDLVLQPLILALAREILGKACERIQLNVAQAIAVHPGEIEQFPHCDHDMWAGEKGTHEYLLNVMWPLTEFTASNGATRIYPGTHRQKIESLDQLGTPIAAECQPGDAICFLGSTVHGAGPNLTRHVRRAVVIGYSLGWLKPYENLWLAYPPEVAREFPAELAELAGYCQHRPNLGNYEGQCPSILLRDDIAEFPRATDALRDDQKAAVREFAEAQRGEK
ncbi:phytanoyl-CoA dioxygenase family protein [Pelagerythrobacter marinus]|uniref:phytanoyl-CoA dioxygenase family protein n=1 Tax=Pelagerythrobacter marinus TaxID=538382 RepID=UPI0020372AE9|nr:phytanoyl-CoA dioxygenase family protein [Pelagerythrobacter marinus]USA38859.1 phytanoyl-CoA dioxygenase family protein [Pelagerythrobacter marinus]WPZ07062.1 phytanoyl-CoA dioxygenase family protein [Pelagerythrobacter marinus]